MPERSFFDFRYAIPGYTFILLIIIINHVPLFEIMADLSIDSTAFGAFLAFLSLFSGSAIGFLISQLWWWRFQQNHKEYEVSKKPIEALIDTYKLMRAKNAEQKRAILAAYDYIIHSEKNVRLSNYIDRRWDMYHLLSSEFFALIISSISGVFCRVLFQFLPFKFALPTFQDILDYWNTSFGKGDFWQRELWILLILFILVAVLGYLLLKGRKWVITQHSDLSEAVIRRSDVKQEDLAEAFPDLLKCKKNSKKNKVE